MKKEPRAPANVFKRKQGWLKTQKSKKNNDVKETSEVASYVFILVLLWKILVQVALSFWDAL